ncbi:MAG: Yip1 family protein [Chloroflexota bacterium]|nr:Yip1 family protein [Anaerolineales bacterium]
MNEQTNAPMLPPPSGVAEWFSVWRDAVTKPSEQTFARIAQSPNAKLTTALLWIFLGSLVNFLLASLVQGQMTRQMMQNFGMEGVPDAGGGLIAAICGAPILALISTVLTVLMIGIVQLIAKMFGGRGTFEQLMYAMAAILTPFSMLSGLLTLLTAIPYAGACFGIVGLVVGIYVLVLEIMAVKGVNQFGWGQAIASLLLPLFVFVCCLTVGFVAILQALGPRISDMFQSLVTPVP